MKFVIRAGGVGTRLWPYSRAHKPKQFHCMAGEQTMLQDAVARIGAIAALADVVRIDRIPVAGAGERAGSGVAARATDRRAGAAQYRTGHRLGVRAVRGSHPGCTVASLGSDH